MFVKEIEHALSSGEIDIAVHSAKDLPATLPDGLTIGAFSKREDPRDVLVSKSGLALDKLPNGARIGTSSPRRQAMLKSMNPHLNVIPVRGNVGTRLQKARRDDYDGVILAAAGINRLGKQSEITEYFDPNTFVPDTGQGSLAVEARESDSAVLAMLASVNHDASSIAVRSERAFLKRMGGGCKVPVAAYARFQGDNLHIVAMAAAQDGSQIFRTELDFASFNDPEEIGCETAESLLSNGAADIVSQGDSL